MPSKTMRTHTLLLALATRVTAQMGMEGMGMGSGRRQRDKEPLAFKGDLPLIKCDVCEIVASEVFREVEKQRAAAPMTSKASQPGAAKVQVSSFSEAEVSAILEGVCNRRKEAGEWLWYIDLVESAKQVMGFGAPYRGLTKKEKASQKNYLQVWRTQRGGDIRKWDRESATVKRSCDVLLDDDVGDLEDVVVPLWRGGLEEKAVKKLLCREASSRCGKDRKPVKDREDLEFNPQEKTLLDTERMMENMKDQGMPMVMQSRGDMMEELYEQMEGEGLSRAEADAFMDSVKGGEGDEPPPEEFSAGSQETDYDEEEGEL